MRVKAFAVLFNILAVIDGQRINWCTMQNCAANSHVACNNNGVNEEPVITFKLLILSTLVVFSNMQLSSGHAAIRGAKAATFEHAQCL